MGRAQESASQDQIASSQPVDRMKRLVSSVRWLYSAKIRLRVPGGSRGGGHQHARGQRRDVRATRGARSASPDVLARSEVQGSTRHATIRREKLSITACASARGRSRRRMTVVSTCHMSFAASCAARSWASPDARGAEAVASRTAHEACTCRGGGPDLPESLREDGERAGRDVTGVGRGHRGVDRLELGSRQAIG